jgi:hypothetical protein
MGVRVDDLRELWHAGAVDLPQVAVQYSELAVDLHQTGRSQEAAFRRSIGGMGRLYDQWTRLRNAVQDEIAVRSHNNLVAAGETLVKIADSYATTEYLNAEQINQYHAYVESIESSDEGYRRPPYVPDAPSSDDAHPEEYSPTGGYY